MLSPMETNDAGRGYGLARTDGDALMDQEQSGESRESAERRASDLLRDARRDAEALLRDAERRAEDLLRASRAEPAERSAELLRDVAVQLTHVVSSAEEDRRMLRSQTETLRVLVEALREDFADLRERIDRSLERAEAAPIPLVREREEREFRPLPVEREEERADPRDTLLEPAAEYVHLFLENVRTFSQLTALYQSLLASPSLRGVSISRFQGAEAHLLLDLEESVRAGAIIDTLERADYAVTLDTVDGDQRTIRATIG